MEDFDKNDAPGPRIVLFDDEEMWTRLEGAWIGYPNRQQYAELEAGSKPKHLVFMKEPLGQMLDPRPDGKEAEELRAGIERLIAWRHEEAAELRQALRNLLDRVDARDWLGYQLGYTGDVVAGTSWCADHSEQQPFERWWREAGDPDDAHWCSIRDALRRAFEAGRHSVLGDLDDDHQQ